MAGQNPTAPLQAVIFDADILLARFRGSEEAEAFIRSVPFALRKVSAVAYMELMQGAANHRELNIISRYVRRNFSGVVPVTEAATYQAMRLIESHALPHGLRVSDALIAATALVHGYRLATANERHYRPIKGLKMLSFRSTTR